MPEEVIEGVFLTLDCIAVRSIVTWTWLLLLLSLSFEGKGMCECKVTYGDRPALWQVSMHSQGLLFAILSHVSCLVIQVRENYSLLLFLSSLLLSHACQCQVSYKLQSCGQAWEPQMIVLMQAPSWYLLVVIKSCVSSCLWHFWKDVTLLTRKSMWEMMTSLCPKQKSKTAGLRR